jgi:hypothetical protein
MLVLCLIIHTLLIVLLLHVVSPSPSSIVNSVLLISVQRKKRNTGALIKSLARPTSQCILFDDENISFDASLVIYIYI